MNTHERIMANERCAGGCAEFQILIYLNNPISGAHWATCLENNPGGNTPNLNPTESEEFLESLHAPRATGGKENK